MSIMDVDKVDEKIDYEVIYKKKFDEINNQLDNIKSMLDYVIDEQHKLIDYMDILRVHLNNMLPEEDPKIYFDSN